MTLDRDEPGTASTDLSTGWGGPPSREPPDWPPSPTELAAIRHAAARLAGRLDGGRRTAAGAEIAAPPTASRREEPPPSPSPPARPQRPACDAGAIDGLRQDIAALRNQLHRRRRTTRRATRPAVPAPALSAADATPPATAAFSSEDARAVSASPAPRVATATTEVSAVRAAVAADDARLARIEALLTQLVSLHAAQGRDPPLTPEAAKLPPTSPQPTRPPPSSPPADLATGLPTTGREGEDVETMRPSPVSVARPSPAAGSFARLGGLLDAAGRAARRSGRREPVLGRSAPGGLSSAPIAATPRADPSGTVRAPRFGAAVAAVALVAGAYAVLHEPSRATTASRDPAGDPPAIGVTADPTTTGSLPDTVAAAPFAVAATEAEEDPAAALQTASALLDDPKGPQEAATAAELLLSAARAGLPAAAFRLATLYERGIGVPISRDAAIAWYRRAAAGGHVNAMHNLAALLSTGPDADERAAEALGWFRKAAERGFVDSQFNLAVLLQAGLGGRPDPAEAYRWLAVAAAAGDRDAARRRDELSATLGPRQRADIDRDVAAWRPTAVDPAANGDVLAGASAAAPVR